MSVSKFFDNMIPTETGKRYRHFGKFEVNESTQPSDFVPRDEWLEYVIGWTWAVKMVCPPDRLDDAKKAAIHEFKELLFKDIRELVERVDHAAWSGDMVKVLDLLYEIRKEIS